MRSSFHAVFFESFMNNTEDQTIRHSLCIGRKEVVEQEEVSDRGSRDSKILLGRALRVRNFQKYCLVQESITQAATVPDDDKNEQKAPLVMGHAEGKGSMNFGRNRGGCLEDMRALYSLLIFCNQRERYRLDQ